MGGPCVCRRGQDREDQNGLEPIGGSEIGTSLDTGHYPRTNDFTDCSTATDLYSTANQHTKTNLHSSPCLAHIHLAAYGYPDADSHADAGSNRNAHADPNSNAHTHTDPRAHSDSNPYTFPCAYSYGYAYSHTDADANANPQAQVEHQRVICGRWPNDGVAVHRVCLVESTGGLPGEYGCDADRLS